MRESYFRKRPEWSRAESESELLVIREKKRVRDERE